MGAKQSKRSVDISGKEAETAGEVAAAGAGGEGRVEPLADVDALKPAPAPQLNGDAHIHEQTDKEKQLDVGTPENEKDATTEKEGKQEESEEKEVVITNGDSAEQKTENGDSTPTPEETKKPKKEKVKKKWSLRSISFSRKDKPKQEKKQKEEEPKTNSEPEKVPEEAAEVTTEVVANEGAEVKSETTETKEEKTPETPVTEPITNGSNTPESPKEEILSVKETVEVASELEKTETKVEPEPEQLPINGLSIEEPVKETTEVAQSEEKKSEVSPAEPTETVPAAEIPVQIEVCVDQMPLIESTPPPLPANPPPSSVATFAATTMAPDLTDASLANTAESAIPTPPILDNKADSPKECHSELSPTVLTNNETDIHVPSPISQDNVEAQDTIVAVNVEALVEQAKEISLHEEKENKEEIKKDESQVPEIDTQVKEVLSSSEQEELQAPISPESPTLPETLESDTSEAAGDLPPPPPPEDDEDSLNDDIAIEKIEPPTPEEMSGVEPIVVNSEHSNGEIAETNGVDTELMNGNVEPKEVTETQSEQALENATGECNGNAHPAPPAAPQPQEPVAVSDKIADLIPEVPVVPELNTETLQESSAVVAAD